jgi:radical SAM superfamily enzyme YgiQ (UPF0313 family)
MPTIPIDDIEKSITNESLRSQALSLPMGILYIASYLKKHNKCRVGLIDYIAAFTKLAKYKNADDFITSVARQDAKFTPDVIAFSLLFSASYQFFERCLDILSRMWPKAVVIVGGTHATNTTKELLELKDVDYVIRGEAEISFSEFIKQLSCGENIKVKGIYSKKDTSKELNISELVVELDKIPFPDWELVDIKTYITSSFNRGTGLGKKFPSCTIVTTRGCPYQCTFCSSHTVHGYKMRYRSIENVITEINFLRKKYNIGTLLIEDDLFTVNRKRIFPLLREIKKTGISNIEIPNGLYVNNLDEEIIDELISCGLRACSLAIESGSEYVQNIIKKNCDLKKTKRLIDYFKNKGVIVKCFFIMGFPGETKEQMRETVDYIKLLKADWYVLQVATPLIGTEMYNQFLEMGCIQDNVTLWSKTLFDSRQFDTPQISADEINDLVYRTNLDCNFINNPNKMNGHFEKAVIIFEEVVSNYPFHIIAWHCLWECYKNLGYDQKAHQTETHIRKLIQTDKRASEMFAKYGDMIEERSIL